MKRYLILAAAVMFPVCGFSQPLPAGMLQNGMRLKEGIAALNAQWKNQTGQMLITPSDLSASNNNSMNGGENANDKSQKNQQTKLRQEQEKAMAGGDDFTPAVIGDRYKIPIGYIARATLEITANTDNPGPIKAMLTQPIYSIDRKRILFPTGSVVVGKIVGPTSGENQAINQRGMFLPTHIVRPDGGAMRIMGQDLLDRYGVNGVGDQTNYHILPMLAAAVGLSALESLPQVLSNLAQKNNTFNEMSSSSGQYIQQTGQTTLQEYMNLRPTITVRAGRVPILIFFNHEQYAPEWRAKDEFHLTNVEYKGGMP